MITVGSYLRENELGSTDAQFVCNESSFRRHDVAMITCKIIHCYNKV